MTIQEIEQQIIDEFANFDEWIDKYAYIIDLGKECPVIDEKDKTEANLIKGCQSRVWVSCEYRDSKVYFKADSDAVITKGIISLLIRVYSGQTPQDILANLKSIFRQRAQTDSPLCLNKSRCMRWRSR